MCVCCTHLFRIFFPLAFVLVNDLLLSGFSLFLFWNCVRFCFLLLLLFVVVVGCCCMHLYFMFADVSYQINVLSLMFFHGVSEINYLTC